MEEIKERSCDNCKYYSRHYCWTESGFCAVNCGHCENTLRPINERINYSFVACCGFWECGDEIIKERNESILKAVRSMAERADEIAKIFEDKK